MTDTNTPGFCPSCGATLHTGAVYCGHCGVPIVPEQILYKPVEQSVPDEQPKPAILPVSGAAPADLPDPSIPPRLGRAISIGWEILMQDVVGAMLVVLVVGLCHMALSVFSYFSLILVIPLQVGFIGWAEARRRGLSPGVRDFFDITFARMGDAIPLGGVIFLISLVYVIPVLILEFTMLGISPFSMPFTIFFSHGTLPPTPTLPSLLALAATGLVGIAAIIFGPLTFSYMGLAAWAISQGHKFKKSSLWALEKIKKQYYSYWWIGIVIYFIAGIGVLLCWVGIILSIPLAYIIFAEIASDTGEGD